jgi:LmbE family N-acetylglucosaminyl deacetylase
VADADSSPIDRSFAGRTVLAVFAHPDDESLACGGTLARLADAGARVVLLCASHGESGSISDPALVPDGNLGRVRVDELRDAAGVLGLAEVLVFDHPDGQLRWDDVPELHAEIVMTVTRIRPDVVITFDEDGLYWHLDHVGIHERTTTAIRAFGADAPPLYYVTMPKGVMHELVEAALGMRGAPADSSVWGIEPDAFGDQAAAPTFVVDVGDWVARKLEALRRHRTQMGPHNPFGWLDEQQARRWLGIEQFRRAPIATSRESVFEQLGKKGVGSPS